MELERSLKRLHLNEVDAVDVVDRVDEEGAMNSSMLAGSSYRLLLSKCGVEQSGSSLGS